MAQRSSSFEHDGALSAFAGVSEHLLRTFPVTSSLLAAIAFVYALQWGVAPMLGVEPWSGTWEALFYAEGRPSVSFVLAPLSHLGPIHLALNAGCVAVVLATVRIRYGVRKTIVLVVAALYAPFLLGSAIAPPGVIGMGASAVVVALIPPAFLRTPNRSPFTGEAVSGGKRASLAALAVMMSASIFGFLALWAVQGHSGTHPLLGVKVSHVGHAMGSLVGLALLGVVAVAE